MKQVDFTWNTCSVDELYGWKRKGMQRKANLWAIEIKKGRQRTELWGGQRQEENGRGLGWDIKKIVSVWVMVLYGSLMCSDGQDDWQRVWPLVTVHHLGLPPSAHVPLSKTAYHGGNEPLRPHKTNRLNSHSSLLGTHEPHDTQQSYQWVTVAH